MLSERPLVVSSKSDGAESLESVAAVVTLNLETVHAPKLPACSNL